MSIVGTNNRYLSSVLNYLDADTSTDVLTTTLAKSSSSSSTDSFTGTESTSTDSTTSEADISTAATLLSALSTLQKQDSAAFQEATSEIADSLHEAADDATDTTEKYQLNSLAAKFSNAATTGSMSSLTSSSSSSSLRGYGSSSSSLVSSYLTGNLSADVFNEVTDIVQDKLTSVLSASSS